MGLGNLKIAYCIPLYLMILIDCQNNRQIIAGGHLCYIYKFALYICHLFLRKEIDSSYRFQANTVSTSKLNQIEPYIQQNK